MAFHLTLKPLFWGVLLAQFLFAALLVFRPALNSDVGKAFVVSAVVFAPWVLFVRWFVRGSSIHVDSSDNVWVRQMGGAYHLGQRGEVKLVERPWGSPPTLQGPNHKLQVWALVESRLFIKEGGGEALSFVLQRGTDRIEPLGGGE